jgi:hypothetical protein
MIGTDLDQVLVIRFWQEQEAQEMQPPSWRARITYVNSGQQFYASSIEEAFAVVRSLLVAMQKEGEVS